MAEIDTSALETRLFINGEFVKSESGKTFQVVNPATEEVITSVEEALEADVNKAVAAAKAAFKRGSVWRKKSGADRRDLLLKLADLLEAKKNEQMNFECHEELWFSWAIASMHRSCQLRKKRKASPNFSHIFCTNEIMIIHDRQAES